MIQLPFVQIAVLDPIISLVHHKSSKFDNVIQAELAAWLSRIESLGASACYPRIENHPLGHQIIDWLSNRVFVLAPAKLYDPNLKVWSWHHKSNTESIIFDQAILQGISCHSKMEIERAILLGFDYAFLSPIFPTLSHENVPNLGLDYLKETCLNNRIPIVALGGLDFEKGRGCIDLGAKAWAGIRCYL